MSAANFHTMAKFPLFVILNESFEYGLAEENGNETDETFFDNDECQDWCEEVEGRLSKLNTTLLFHKVELKSGYYDGVQFYVNERYNDIRVWSKVDYRNEFDMNRSTTLRKYDAEIKRITKALRQIADGHGMMELNCVGVFSSGEAVYERAKGGKK